MTHQIITKPNHINPSYSAAIARKIFIFLILCFGFFLENACAFNEHKISSKQNNVSNDKTKEFRKNNYSEKECLNLTIKDSSYEDATNRLVNIKELINWSSLLKKNKSKMALMAEKTKYMNNKCYWSISVYEDQESHFVFWKTFLIGIDRGKMYEENYANDSYQLINQ